jgi:hypothetical protein
MKRGNRAGNRFDVFMNMSAGNDTRAIPSNEDIRKRNLADYAVDLAAEEKTNADAAALAQRNAEEERLGISGMMQKAREHDARENEALRKRWAHSYESIAKFVAFDDNDPAGNILAHSYYDKFHTMPHVTEPVEISGEEAQKAALNFFEWLERVQGVVLDDDSKSKIMLYVGLVAFVDKLIDPRLSSCWNAAYERLANELEVLNVRKPEPKTAAAPVNKISNATSREQDKRIADDDFIDETGGWITAWSESVEKGFGIRMTIDQKRKALDYIVDVLDGKWNLHESWDKARIHLANIGVLVCADGTLPLTEKEVILRKLDGLDLAVPSQRAEYLKLANYINYNQV